MNTRRASKRIWCLRRFVKDSKHFPGQFFRVFQGGMRMPRCCRYVGHQQDPVELRLGVFIISEGQTGTFPGIVWVSAIKSVVGRTHIYAVFKFSLIINSGEVALLLILVNVQLKAQMSGNFHKWIQLHLIVLLMRENLMKTNRWSI